MREEEYLTVSNRVRVSMLISILKDIYGNSDVIDIDEKNKMIETLYVWEGILFGEIEQIIDAFKEC